jgi:hypothetical protein
MKLQFLCAGHREWLSKSPSQAVDCWSNSLETGQIFCDQYRWHEALPYVGSAYEASEIILSTTFVDRYNATHFFTTSALLLVDVLTQLGRYEDSQQVCQLAIQRLKRELSKEGTDGPHINQQLKRVTDKFGSLPPYICHIPSTNVVVGQISDIVH